VIGVAGGFRITHATTTPEASVSDATNDALLLRLVML